VKRWVCGRKRKRGRERERDNDRMGEFLRVRVIITIIMTIKGREVLEE
jgi:hypothetical protein